MRDIPGYEGFYQIDERGNIFSLKKGLLLKPYLSYSKSSGMKYKGVCLSRNGFSKKHSVHRLVALTFINNPERKNCVDHINRIQDDNRVENLRWSSYSENQLNKVKTGKKTSSRHKGVSYDKLSKIWVVWVCKNKKKFKLGKFQSELEAAKAYNDFVKTEYGEFAILNVID